MKTREMCLTGIMAALLCLLGPLTVPVGPVPLSVLSFGIYLAAQTLGARLGTFAVITYILLGMAGMPVFAGFTGGVSRVAGPTGGYILGYIPCALITGMGGQRRPVLKMAAGTVAMYTLGTAWFMCQSGTAVLPTLWICVAPFLPGDIVKIIAAHVTAARINKTLKAM